MAPADVVVPLLAGPFGSGVRGACAALAARHRLGEIATIEHHWDGL